MKEQRLITVLAATNASLCLAAGLAYLTVSPTELPIGVLVTLGVVGCCALVAAGLWQHGAPRERRRLPLLTLGVLAATYLVASALGFEGDEIARTARLEPTGLPRSLHAAGVVAAFVLVTVTAVFMRRTSRRTHRSSSHAGEPA